MLSKELEASLNTAFTDAREKSLTMREKKDTNTLL